MRIRRWIASTASRPPHSVSGSVFALRLQAVEQPRRGFLAILGGQAHGRAHQRLLRLGQRGMRFLDQPLAFLEAAPRPVEHRFDFDQSGRQRVRGHRCLRPYYCGGGADASWPSPTGAAMIVAGRRALVDDVGGGVAGGRADAGRDAVAAGGVEHAGLGRAARRGAAEQGVDRLALGAVGRQADGAGDRRGQRIIGRDDQRRVARDGELVERLLLADAARAKRERGHDEEEEGLTHVHWFLLAPCPSTQCRE